jgi:hypothetical protein
MNTPNPRDRMAELGGILPPCLYDITASFIHLTAAKPYQPLAAIFCHLGYCPYLIYATSVPSVKLPQALNCQNPLWQTTELLI